MPAVVEFVDIAGLVAGASKGEGLGNQFLANIRETDAIANVVRCFEDDNVIHVAGKVDPISDIEVIHTELALADMRRSRRRSHRFGKTAQSGDKEAMKLVPLLERVRRRLDGPPGARPGPRRRRRWRCCSRCCLLTAKPALYIANVGEHGFENNPAARAREGIRGEGRRAGGRASARRSKREIADLADEDKQVFLADMGMTEPGLDRLIRAAYDLLGLQTYFTAGEKEVRAWTIHKGDTAPQAAA